MRTIPTPVAQKWDCSYFLLLGIFLVSTRFWSFQSVPPRLFDALEIPLLLFLFIWAIRILLSSSPKPNHQSPMKVFVILLVGLQLASFLPCYFVHGQSFSQSFLAQRAILYWSLYPILHSINASKKRLISAILTMAFIWTAITIGQQFTYPRYWFFSRSNDELEEAIELRAGIYRFFVSAPEYAVLGTFYFINRSLKNFKLIYMIAAIFLLVGVYYFGTRQVTFSAVFGIAFLIAVTSSANWKKYAPVGILILLAATVSLAIYWKPIFGELVDATMDDASSGNVRVSAFRYFVFEHWQSWINPFFGNGLAHKNSEYGQQIYALKFSGFFQSDIGIFGAFSVYGIFYVLAILSALVYATFKALTDDEIYVRTYFFYTALTLPLSALFTTAQIIPLYCALFYIIDISAKPKQPTPLQLHKGNHESPVVN